MPVTYFERIVVGLALAPVDRGVLQYARMVGEMGEGRTRFTFIHVVAAEYAAPAAAAEAVATARTALQTSVEEVFGPSQDHDVRVLNDNLVDALLTEAADGGADLIMVGHRKDSGRRRSLSRRLALKAPCSVWMVPEGVPAQIGGVVVAVDMSHSSALALSVGSLVARRAGLQQCTALHVLEPGLIGFENEEQQVAARSLDRFLLPLDVHGTQVVRLIAEGRTVSGVVQSLLAPRGYDLVVVGTRGRSRSAAVLLGSESEQVLHESPVPVLLTRERGERLGVLRALLTRDPAFT